MLITTREELAAWLDEEAWFDDSHVYRLSPPSTNEGASTAVLEIGRWVGGGLDPGDEMVFRVFRLTARGLTHYSVQPPGAIADHWSQGIELVDYGLGFSIDTPGLVQIRSNTLEVERLDDRRIRVKAGVSDREIWVTSVSGRLPRFRYWTDALARRNLSAKWNLCGDDEALAHDPRDHYVGWCLQFRGEAQLEEVVFLDCSARQPSGYSLHLQRRGPSGRLWRVVLYLAAREKDAIVRTGNVELNRDEWRRYLATRLLPAEPRGWSQRAR